MTREEIIARLTPAADGARAGALLAYAYQWVAAMDWTGDADADTRERYARGYQAALYDNCAKPDREGVIAALELMADDLRDGSRPFPAALPRWLADAIVAEAQATDPCHAGVDDCNRLIGIIQRHNNWCSEGGDGAADYLDGLLASTPECQRGMIAGLRRIADAIEKGA